MSRCRVNPGRSVAALAAAIMLAAASASQAEPVEDFYRGKQLRIVIRAGPGGNYDLYSRLLARHLVRHIPGRPTVLPENMPGGSGLTALNYVAEIAPKDGTVLTLVTQTFPVEEALGLNRNLKVDLRKLAWLGNMSETNTFLITSRFSATRTLDDAKRRETIMAVPSTADVTAWMTALLNNTLGTRFKLVAGYPSGPAMNLAMERKEVEGRGTTNPRAMFGEGAGAFHLLLQSGLRKDDGYPDVPLLRDLAGNDEQRRVFDYFSKMGALARPIALAAGVPGERLAALRAAFKATMADEEFLAEAKRQNMDIGMMSGEDVERIVEELVDVAPPLLEELKQAIAASAAAAPRSAGQK